MSIMAPHVRKHLSADALFRLVHSDFTRLPDYRVGDTEIALADALMSAFAMFSLCIYPHAGGTRPVNFKRAEARLRKATGAVERVAGEL